MLADRRFPLAWPDQDRFLGWGARFATFVVSGTIAGSI
jgi:hypothetical protein